MADEPQDREEAQTDSPQNEAPAEEQGQPETSAQEEAGEPAQEPEAAQSAADDDSADESAEPSAAAEESDAADEPAQEEDAPAPEAEDEEPAADAEAEGEQEPQQEVEGFELPPDDAEPLEPAPSAELGEEEMAEMEQNPTAADMMDHGPGAGLAVGIGVVAIAVIAVFGWIFLRPQAPQGGGEAPAPACPFAGKAPPAPSKADQAAELVKQLDTDDFADAQTAQAKLIKLGKASVPALAAALQSPKASLRANAVETLGKLKLKDAVKPLARVLLSDSDADVRSAAAAALGRIGDLSGVDPLIKALVDKNEDVQIAADEALQAITNNVTLTANLDTDDPKAIQKIWKDWWAKNKDKLAAKGSGLVETPAGAQHVHMWRSPDKPPIASLHPVEGMPGGGRHGQEGSHALLKYLKTLDNAALMQAVQRHSEWLLEQLQADKPSVCVRRLASAKTGLERYARARLPIEQQKELAEYAAAGADRKKKIESDVVFFLKDRLRGGDPELRGNAALQLGANKAAKAADLLAKAAAEDKSRSVRLCAAIALKQLGQPDKAKAVFLAVLADSKAYAPERALAAYELGQMRCRDAVDPLIAAVGSSDKELRSQAHLALVAITQCKSIDPNALHTPKELQAKWAEWRKKNK